MPTRTVPRFLKAMVVAVLVSSPLVTAVSAVAATPKPYITSSPPRAVATGDITLKGTGLVTATPHKGKVTTYRSDVLRATFLRDGDVGSVEATKAVALARDPDAHGLTPLGVQTSVPAVAGKYWLTVTTAAGTSNRRVIIVLPLKSRSAPRAHLDPAFSQDQSNPLDVTFSYDATTIVTSVYGVTDPSIPDGVLNFYSDGSLTCSTNVGGATTSATCEVIYSTYGYVKTTVEYLSGTSSATQTSTEGIWWSPTTITPTFDAPPIVGCSGQPEYVCQLVIWLSGSYPPPTKQVASLGTVQIDVNGSSTPCGTQTLAVSNPSDQALSDAEVVCSLAEPPYPSPPWSVSWSYSGATYPTYWLPSGGTITLSPTTGSASLTAGPPQH